MDVFTDNEKNEIIRLIKSIREDGLMIELVKTSAQLKIAVDDQNNSTRLFSPLTRIPPALRQSTGD